MTTSSGAGGSWRDDEVCPRCRVPWEGFDLEGAPERHACCSCRDGGRVMLALQRSEPGFGHAVPCPDCGGRGASPGLSGLEAEVVRMRIPALFRGCEIATWLPDNARPRLAVQTYVLAWPPSKPLLFLTGSKGQGKTHLACGVLRAAFEAHGVRGQFWPVIDLLDRYRATFDEDRALETVEQVDAQLRRCEVLVLDDYGTHKSSEWAEERLFRVIDERYREKQATVVTSNLALVEMPDRVRSRLADGSVSTLVQFAGADRRIAG